MKQQHLLKQGAILLLTTLLCLGLAGCGSLFEDAVKREFEPVVPPVSPDVIPTTATEPEVMESEPEAGEEPTETTTEKTTKEPQEVDIEILELYELAEFDRLDEAVLHYLKQNKIDEENVGLAYVPVAEGTGNMKGGYFHNGDQGFEPASTIKVFVALEYAERIMARELDWDDMIEFDAENQRVFGAGPYADTLEDGDKVSIHDLVWEMLRSSDNTALEMLQTYYREKYDAWPLDNQINRYNLPYRSENRILTPKNLIQGVSVVYQGAKESHEYAFLLEAMENSIYGEYFNALFPQILSAHKTGNLNGAYSDCGIIYDTRPYYFAIMTEDLEEPFKVIQELGSLVQQFHSMQSGE